MSFKGESPVRENKVGKFIKSKVDNVKANVKGVVDRVKSIGSGGSSEDNNDAEENTIKVAGNNTKINSSKTAQTSASSSIEDTLPKTPMAKYTNGGNTQLQKKTNGKIYQLQNLPMAEHINGNK